MTKTSTINEDRLKVLDGLILHHGRHPEFAQGHCAMEVVAYIAGEPHSDHPRCVCPVISAFMRSWNDGISDDETRTRLLKPLLPLLVGTRSTRRVQERRMWMIVDWSLRTSTPALIRATGFTEFAEQLERLPEVISRARYKTASDVIRKARAEAEKRRDELLEKLRNTFAASTIDAVSAAYTASVASSGSEIDVICLSYAVYAASSAHKDDESFAIDAAYASHIADAASAAYAAAVAFVADMIDEENFKPIIETAEKDGYTAARKVADETIGKMIREKLAGVITLIETSSRDLIRRMCAITEASFMS